MPHKVLFVGPGGAGKTSMLASIYHLIATSATAKNTGNGVDYLRHAVGLMPAEWPAATSQHETYSWAFKGKLPLFSGFAQEQFEITFFDYSGTWLDGSADERKAAVPYTTLLQELENADTIIGIIDGMKVIAHVNAAGGHTDDLFFRDLPIVVAAMMTPARLVTLHLAITKWDCVRDIGIGLNAVRNSLLSVTDFREFVASLGDHAPWLIPVSARWSASLSLEPPSEPGPSDPFSIWMLLAFCSGAATHLRELQRSIRNISAETIVGNTFPRPSWVS